MKNYKSILPFIVAISLLFVGCKKDDGFIPDEYLSKLTAVPVISTAVNTTGSQAIDVLNLSKFEGKFNVSLYFTDKPAPQKIDIVVRKNKSNSDVKVFQASVTTFPGTYTITAAQLAALFGTAVKLNDTYDFGADIYVGDKKFEAFPIGGVGNSSGPINMIDYSEFATFGAICAYDPTIYEGNFIVVSDGFVYGIAAGTVIQLTKVSATSFSFVYPNPYAQTPIAPVVVTVNTGNNVVAIAKQKISGNFGGYPNYFLTATGNANNFAAPCDKEVTMNISHTVDAGSFGTAPLRLRKQ